MPSYLIRRQKSIIEIPTRKNLATLQERGYIIHPINANTYTTNNPSYDNSKLLSDVRKSKAIDSKKANSVLYTLSSVIANSNTILETTDPYYMT